MGFIPSLLGIGTNNGAQFQARGSGDEALAGAMGGTGASLNQMNAFLQSLAGQNGIGNQSSVFNQQQGLANQLQDQAQGGGPNPALNQLAMTTGQNTANQAALMAGQRGINNNPALAAQLIGQQGAGIQQQAGGQAALQRAQQQLAAQQQLQQQQAQMAGLSSTQVGQQSGALNNLGQAQLANQGQQLSMLANQNSTNAGVAGVNAQQQGGMLNGLASGIGTGLGIFKAHGGLIQKYADGGTVEPSGPQSSMGKWGQAMGKIFGSDSQTAQQSGMYQGANALGTALGQGIKSIFTSGPPAPPTDVSGTAPLAAPVLSSPIMEKKGGKVPGKAIVDGDSETNDKVPAMLSPGELVIPRSKVKDPKKTADFVNQVLGMNLKARGK